MRSMVWPGQYSISACACPPDWQPISLVSILTRPAGSAILSAATFAVLVDLIDFMEDMLDARIAIIGGGITGLSAAYALERAAAASGLSITSTLIEASPRWGGKIRSERIADHGGLLIEAGPDSFVPHKPWATDLARTLGLGDQIMGSNPAYRTTFVLRNGRPCPMPQGLQLLIPTRIRPFLASALFSPAGKLRMLCERWIPARSAADDESLASFVRRRFGTEALDRIGEPLLAGIHSNDPEQQSLQATFPRFMTLERQYGS